ncbi:MAG: rod shape-determining protein MreC [Clostridia bacterium]|nr:rod shape-determining protein MreC [Clostridia bacterium]
MPVQNGLVYLKNKVVGNSSFFEDIDKLKRENESLKDQKSEIEKSLREIEIIKAENATLKEYLNIKEKYSEYEIVPAYIINKDISNYTNVVVINVGKDSGIDVNMTVIADEGLVGHVISVTDNTAKVQTITDTASVVTSTVSTTKDSIIVRGTLEADSQLKATYIPTDASIVEGDRVETSGIGGVYPKGIYIGKIKQVINTNNIIDRYALVETAVNFRKLETVAVIKK